MKQAKITVVAKRKFSWICRVRIYRKKSTNQFIVAEYNLRDHRIIVDEEKSNE